MTFSWLEWFFYPLLVVVIIIIGIISLSPGKKISEDISAIANTLLKAEKEKKPRNRLEEETAKMAVKDRGAYFHYE